MFEMLFYCGIVFGAVFLILAVILFFHENIPFTIKYFLKIKKMGIKNPCLKKNNIKARTSIPEKSSKEEDSTMLLSEGKNSATVLLQNDKTVLLSTQNDGLQTTKLK